MKPVVISLRAAARAGACADGRAALRALSKDGKTVVVTARNRRVFAIMCRTWVSWAVAVGLLPLDVLRGADLTNAHLEGAWFSGLDLKGTCFYGARLDGATLVASFLDDADMRYAHLTRVELYNAVLRGAKMGGSLLCDASLRYADLTGADLTGARIMGANFHGSVGADLKGTAQ